MAEVVESTPVHLRGNGRPVTEERTLTALKVTGTIPAELDGRFVRNGANPFTGTSAHPFFGDGMVHGIRLRDGKAEWYRNRYVQTPFIANPSTDILDPSVLMDMKSSKANTHVIGHAGKILALEEGHFPYVLDGELDTLGATDFDGVLNGSFTAHPKICPVSGELLAFGYSAFEPYLRYLRVSADGRLVQVENITVGGPTMMHDFNVTRNHVVFMDLPAVFRMGTGDERRNAHSLGRQLSGAPGRDAPRRQRRSGRVVRHRSLLCLPPHELLRRRRLHRD